jgi:hypothetical protein
VLIEHLPPESATMTAIRNDNPDIVTEDGPDPAEGRWSQLEMLLASVVDELRYLRYEYRTANGDKKSKTPNPIARPGVAKPKSENKLTNDQYDWLYKHINGELPPGAGFVEMNVDARPYERST